MLDKNISNKMQNRTVFFLLLMLFINKIINLKFINMVQILLPLLYKVGALSNTAQTSHVSLLLMVNNIQ